MAQQRRAALFGGEAVARLVNPRSLTELALSKCVVETSDSQLAVVDIAVGFSIGAVKQWDNWMASFNSCRAENNDFPHIHRVWNPPNSIYTLQTDGAPKFSDEVITSFITGRFVQWLFETPEGRDAAGPASYDRLKELFIPPDPHALRSWGPVSWLHYFADLQPRGYYAVDVRVQDNDRLGVCADPQFLGEHPRQALERLAEGRFFEVRKAGHTVLERILRVLRQEGMEAAARRYLEVIGSTISDPKNHQDRELYQNLYQHFYSWLREAVPVQIPPPPAELLAEPAPPPPPAI